jgi:GNAT superfamily N-acetyltransferase
MIKPLKWRKMVETDLSFFQKIVDKSELFKKWEIKEEDLSSYFYRYQIGKGEWRIWLDGDSQIGITYHVEKADSNGKPWIGTILISPELRKRGFAHRIIEKWKNELKAKGNKIVYATSPYDEEEWIQFLGLVGFDQFKVETHLGIEWLIFLQPL